MPSLDRIPEFDLYKELGVVPTADTATIERAWRAGVRSVHPDRARTRDEPAATARTARLNIAREWLMDPTRRARYDLLRRPGPDVALPNVDPLASWPARRRRLRPSWLRFLSQGIPVFISIFFLSFVFGFGAGIGAVAALSAGMFALYAGVWLLVGVLARR